MSQSVKVWKSGVPFLVIETHYLVCTEVTLFVAIQCGLTESLRRQVTGVRSLKSTRLVQAPEASERDSKLQEWARDRVGRKMRYLEG